MITVDKLREFGADTEDGLGRCFGNEELYLKLVGMIPGDGNFAGLEEAIKAGDLDKAFECAHALKGVLGNLSLTPVCEPVMEITEHLRSRTQMDYEPLLTEIMKQKDALSAMAED
jgi:HPt (histidine-containing phosphotransfer) domain-containing protein